MNKRQDQNCQPVRQSPAISKRSFWFHCFAVENTGAGFGCNRRNVPVKRLFGEDARGFIGKVQDCVREQTDPEHARDANPDGQLGRRGKLNRRQIRRFLAPVNRADDPEIVIKRNHHARQRREHKAIITVIAAWLARFESRISAAGIFRRNQPAAECPPATPSPASSSRPAAANVGSSRQARKYLPLSDAASRGR